MKALGLSLLGLSVAGLFFLPAAAAFALAFIAMLCEPLAPAMTGLLADALYAPSSHSTPFFTLLGIACTCAAYAVHARVKASIIR